MKSFLKKKARVIKYWNRYPRKVWKSPLLEESKIYVGKGMSNMI